MQQSLAMINVVILIKKYGAMTRAVFMSFIKYAVGLTKVLCVEIPNSGHFLQRQSCYFTSK
jgi:hypothetical protein